MQHRSRQIAMTFYTLSGEYRQAVQAVGLRHLPFMLELKLYTSIEAECNCFLFLQRQSWYTCDPMINWSSVTFDQLWPLINCDLLIKCDRLIKCELSINCNHWSTVTHLSTVIQYSSLTTDQLWPLINYDSWSLIMVDQWSTVNSDQVGSLNLSIKKRELVCSRMWMMVL